MPHTVMAQEDSRREDGICSGRVSMMWDVKTWLCGRQSYTNFDHARARNLRRVSHQMWHVCPHPIFLRRGGLDTRVALEEICII